jgi:hypothetical protein
MLGATSVDARLTRNCADAKGAFFNSYNGSSSTDKNLKCEPYNDASALGGYLECIWEAGPCKSAASMLQAGALALLGAVLGAYLM